MIRNRKKTLRSFPLKISRSYLSRESRPQLVRHSVCFARETEDRESYFQVDVRDSFRIFELPAWLPADYSDHSFSLIFRLRATRPLTPAIFSDFGDGFRSLTNKKNHFFVQF